MLLVGIMLISIQMEPYVTLLTSHERLRYEVIDNQMIFNFHLSHIHSFLVSSVGEIRVLRV